MPSFHALASMLERVLRHVVAPRFAADDGEEEEEEVAEAEEVSGAVGSKATRRRLAFPAGRGGGK